MTTISDGLFLFDDVLQSRNRGVEAEDAPDGRHWPTARGWRQSEKSRLASRVVSEQARWFTLSEQANPRIRQVEISRLLVVDDNEDVRYAMYECLSGAGFDVAMARDGIDALALARISHPQAILLDIGMPALDGYSTARAMRRQAALANVPIIAVTGFFDAEHFAQASEAGFDFYFQKPVDIDAMLSLLSDGAGSDKAV